MAEKLIATFGVLGIMIIVSQHFIFPVVLRSHELRKLPISERLKEFPCGALIPICIPPSLLTLVLGILNDLIVPFIIEYMVGSHL